MSRKEFQSLSQEKEDVNSFGQDLPEASTDGS